MRARTAGGALPARSPAAARAAAASSRRPRRVKSFISASGASASRGACATAFWRILTASASFPFASWASAFATVWSSFLSAHAGRAASETRATSVHASRIRSSRTYRVPFGEAALSRR